MPEPTPTRTPSTAAPPPAGAPPADPPPVARAGAGPVVVLARSTGATGALPDPVEPAGAGDPVTTARHPGCATAPELVHRVLGSVLAHLPPGRRTGVALVFAADAYCAWAADRYAGRCRDTSRRLRPSDSIRLETAELLRTFDAGAGWPGDAVILAGADAHGPAARAAVAALRRIRSPLVHCELRAAAPARTPAPAGADAPAGTVRAADDRAAAGDGTPDFVATATLWGRQP
ncbi:hypothetical protein E1091_04405 [Micromonospora fluostatini]|uniref:Uncharacterized protein n=1 Tax=Micromonospora fluostatini TaxID=1629071 RepID=A0ABY2DJW8_9ACTN|nr:hypothetical protein E1091_04405 [Micromonospora fluostatini]